MCRSAPSRSTVQGAELLTISGGGSMRPFLVGGGNVRLSGVTVSNGSAAAPSDGTAPEGGGILNFGTLTVADSVFAGNVAVRGGAIFSAGPLTIARTTFSGNSTTASGRGGAIASAPAVILGSSFSISESTFVGNSAAIGGAISSLTGSLTLMNSTFAENAANFGGGLRAWQSSSARGHEHDVRAQLSGLGRWSDHHGRIGYAHAAEHPDRGQASGGSCAGSPLVDGEKI